MDIRPWRRAREFDWDIGGTGQSFTPNDFPNLNAVTQRLFDFQYYWETIAEPFQWKFTRLDLARFLAKCSHDFVAA